MGPPPTAAARRATTVAEGQTPPGWRLAAFGLLAGGVTAGALSARRGAWRLLAAGLAGSLAASLGPIIVGSRRPRIPPRPPDWTPRPGRTTFSVVVAARNEAAVIGSLVADLAAQDHRGPASDRCFELVVVDDRSVDGTGEIARRAAEATGIGHVTRVVRREGDDLPDGKGAALTAAQPEACTGDVVVVLDADARIGPRFLSTLAWYIEEGAGAVTARRRIAHAGTDLLAGAQADEQTADGEIQRGRWALGGCSEFRGNGIVIRRDLLAELGGWRAEALTEDLDLSSRLAARRGVTVAWAIDAEVWEEPVDRWTLLWRQRVRWAEGAIRRVLEHGPAVLRSSRLPVQARIDFAAYAAQLAAPPVALGVVVGSVARRDPRPALGIGGLYAVAGTILAWDALRWETDGEGRALDPSDRAARAVRAAGFGTIWMAGVPAALWRVASRRGRVRYDKMEHRGGGG
jgi:hypothetical protein